MAVPELLSILVPVFNESRADVARSLALEPNRFDIEPEINTKLLLAGYRFSGWRPTPPPKA
jgi:hypothetical protein